MAPDRRSRLPARQDPAWTVLQRQDGQGPVAGVVIVRGQRPDRASDEFEGNLLQLERSAREGRRVAADGGDRAGRIDGRFGQDFVVPEFV